MVVNVEKKKAVVVLSGGADSSTVAYWAKKEGYDVYAITFNYGQIADREIESARKIVEALDIRWKVVDLSSLKDVFGDVTSLCNPSIPMTSSFSDPIVVPFRNGVFLSIAVAYAVSISAENIFYGAHGSDEAFYPDCRRTFYESFEKAAKLGTGRDISVEAPFNGLKKAELIRIGVQLGVPFEHTWSCYGNNLKHCGICESCENRRRAFEEAGVVDPTEYQE
jgi:7-cyano-7-deazaguanine synthase